MKLNILRKKEELDNINQAPGKMVYVGEKKKRVTTYDVINYNVDIQSRHKTVDLAELLAHWQADKITWINVNGLSDSKAIETLGHHFELHALVLEDIMNTEQRPKVEEYDQYLFLVMKMLYMQDGEYTNEHISMVVGADYVLTFQESENDVFDKLRERIKSGLGLVRTAKSDYLMYAMMDAIVDNYFAVIETLGIRIQQLENSIFVGKADDAIVLDIQRLRPEIIQIRRAVYPLKDMAGYLEKSRHKLITTKTYNYLRDLHDHSIQVSEDVEIYREMTASLMGMYNSTQSNKMNEVMKVLTIMASIFIPLTFITGIYGMNFENMPELATKYGYFVVLCVMILIILLMLWYFKRKKWL